MSLGLTEYAPHTIDWGVSVEFLDRLNLTLTPERISRLKWLLPLGMAVVVVGFELVQYVWMRKGGGADWELGTDVLFYGTFGPLLLFWLLDVLQRWLAERETSALQARLLARANEHLRANQTLSDSTLQSLFATSIYVNDIHDHVEGLPPEAVAQLEAAHQSLDAAIRGLREHLLKIEKPLN